MKRDFPSSWNHFLDTNVRHYATLSSQQQGKLRDDLRVLVAEKNWEGCGGLEITDEIKVTIAAQIAILTLGFQEQYFDRVLSILVYPDAYVAPGQSTAKGGVVLEGDSARAGEAWHRGPVILSWADTLAGSRGQSLGRNLVIHEFAHQLDMLNGRIADGVPPLDSTEQSRRWLSTMDAEYRQLCQDCQQGRPAVLDCYGTTNKAEFFAVATEAFFEQPRKLKQLHATLFGMLQEYFLQDPTRHRSR